MAKKLHRNEEMVFEPKTPQNVSPSSLGARLDFGGTFDVEAYSYEESVHKASRVPLAGIDARGPTHRVQVPS